MRSVGVDPSKGAQDLYPDLAYDPATGHLKANNPGLLGNIVSSIIPQFQLVSALIGHNNNFADILRTNPEAAASMLRSGLGLPNLYRDVNVPQEAFKAETARQSLQDQIRNKALRTGDWTEARKYPGLRPTFDKLDKLMKSNPQILAAYQTQVQSDTLGDVLQNALIQRTVPVG